MRFWFYSNIHRPGTHDIKDPDPWAGQPAQCTWENIEDPAPEYRGRPLSIRGERYINDPCTARILISKPGRLHFDPQQAVDLGFMTAEEMQAKGYKVEDRPDVKVKKPKEVTKPKTDLETMTKNELIEYAGNNKINIDVRKNKPEMKEQILAELALRE
jgi:hypothetical protein